MQLKRTDETAGEPRYDAQTLREVAALASQLQEDRREALTAGDIEAIGEEVGLGRAFVRDALRQLALQRSRDAGLRSRARELRGLAAAWGLTLAWSLLAWAAVTGFPGAASLITLILPPLVAIATGFLAGRRRTGSVAAAVLALDLALVLGSHPSAGPGGPATAVTYLLFGAPVAAWLASHGARLREHFFPLEEEAGGVSSPALLDLLVTVQRQLQEREERRAVLSVSVVEAREMRRNASDALAAHSFTQLQEWAEELVRHCGGECRGTVEAGMACLFPTDSAAVSAARQLQEGMERFNRERSRLTMPFRLRCGLAAGPVAGDGGPSLEALQAPLVERAERVRQQADPGDILVTAELAAAALLELRSLAPLSREAGAEPLFSWRAGQRSTQRP